MFNKRLTERVQALESDLGRIREDLRRLETAISQPIELDSVTREIEAIDERLQDMTLAIAEGIERVDRSERRVRQVVSRAKKQLEDFGIDDPGLSAEAEQLRLDYGVGGEQAGVQQLPAPVAHRVDVTGIPGAWSEQDVQALTERLHGN
jgi:septation ring formation regulator EzrA